MVTFRGISFRTVVKIAQFVRNNYFFITLLAVVGFVGFVFVFRSLTAETETVYAKVKVSQGLWWANTAKPSYWLAKSLQKGMVEKSLSGKPTVEVLSVRYYPWWNTEQFDVYLTVKLDVTKNERTGRYTFKRSPLAIGSPMDLEFAETQVSATVMALSDRPFDEIREERIITLEKKHANTWEGEAVEIGDTYFDGQDVVFEILEKRVVGSREVYSSVGNNYPIDTEKKVDVTITARVNLLRADDKLIFREEQPLQLGRYINIHTARFALQDYVIASISEDTKQ